MKKLLVISLLVVCLFSINAVPAAQALDLGDILKVGGIPLIIKNFSSPLNNFINSLMAKNGTGTRYTTKVVPILSLGDGGYIGAAQVTGQASLVNKTKAVVQVEGNFSGDRFRVKALIPSNTTNPLKFSRVDGVGISAIIDIKI